jgi:hypothetical protein
MKTKLSIMLDPWVIAYFKRIAKHYTLHYQSLINTCLNAAVDSSWIDPRFAKRADPPKRKRAIPRKKPFSQTWGLDEK